MKKTEKALWDVIDHAIFKTEDPEQIRERVKVSGAAWEKERNTLGGYLRQIRRGRNLRTEECAELAGVSRSRWQAWESNREVPSQAELEGICEGLEFGSRKRERLERLQLESPRQRLLILSRYRPEMLAARGVARLGASLEWQKLPSPVREALTSWGERRELCFPDELMEFFETLKDDEAREAWVEEVLSGSE